MQSSQQGAVDQHLGYLDGLRGIAILSVIVVHVGILTRLRGTAFELAFTGQRGVELFYMISAFTLCLSLDGPRSERHPLRNYFIRRLFRIAPLFYAMICLNLLLKHFTPDQTPISRLHGLDVLLGFLFLNGTRPEAINGMVAGGWSIAVETTFYLLLPLLFRYVNTVRRALAAFFISAPVLLKMSARLAERSSDFAHEQYFALFWFPVQLPVFVLGMLGFWIWKEHVKGRPADHRAARDLSLLLLASSFVIYYASLPFYDWRLYSSSYLFLPLILSVSIHPWRLLINRFTRFLGKISYSLYLLHPLVVILVSNGLARLDRRAARPASTYVYSHALAFPAVLLLVLGLSIAVCVLSWKFVEQPGIRMGRRLIARLEGGVARRATPLVPDLKALEAEGNSRDAQF